MLRVFHAKPEHFAAERQRHNNDIGANTDATRSLVDRTRYVACRDRRNRMNRRKPQTRAQDADGKSVTQIYT